MNVLAKRKQSVKVSPLGKLMLHGFKNRVSLCSSCAEIPVFSSAFAQSHQGLLTAVRQ